MEIAVDDMRKLNEGPSEWKLRREFLLLNKNGDLSKERLECLSNCFVYSALYGVVYPQQVMDEVKKRSGRIVNETCVPKIRVETAPPKEDAVQSSSSRETGVAVDQASKLDRGGQWISQRNRERMMRIAGPTFRPIPFVKGSTLTNFSRLSESKGDGEKVETDDESALCFPSLRSEAFVAMKTQLDNISKTKEKKTNSNNFLRKAKPPANFRGSQTREAEFPQKTQPISPPFSGKRIPKKQATAGPPTWTADVTAKSLGDVVIWLRRLFDSWAFIIRKNPDLSSVCGLYNAASKIQVLLDCNFDSRITADGCYCCRLTAMKQKTSAKVCLSEGKARSKKEAKQNACVPLEKFRQRHVNESDLKVDPSDKSSFVLLTSPAPAAAFVPSKAKTPGPLPGVAPSAFVPPPAAPTSCVPSVKNPRSPPCAAAKAARISRHRSEKAPSVFLKEVCNASSSGPQILSNTAAMLGGSLDFNSAPNGHELHFLGRRWTAGPELPLPRAKKALADAALADLRRELWTLRVRQMPDFASLQRVVSVDKAAVAGAQLGSNGAPLDEANVGHRLLRQMGWTADTGLGRERAGRTEPVSAGMTLVRREGLGSQAAGSAAFRGFVSARLRQFVEAGVNAEDLCFSSDFSNDERAFIHQECKRLPAVDSRSFNTADGNRFLVVMRRRTPPQLLDWVRRRGGSTLRYEAIPPGDHPEL